ncbi:MAG: phosphoribosylaminoimidazole synthetase, partial [Micrococcaceae bacterium]|nr:phosphoribosylaminoimidazole synthetase [Micrococcaceae bacterium]
GLPSWVMGSVRAASGGSIDGPDYIQGAKGVDGGSVRLLGSYA